MNDQSIGMQPEGKYTTGDKVRAALVILIFLSVLSPFFLNIVGKPFLPSSEYYLENSKIAAVAMLLAGLLNMYF